SSKSSKLFVSHNPSVLRCRLQARAPKARIMPLPSNRKKGKRIPSGVLEGMNRTVRSSKSEFLQSNDRGAIHQGSTVE
ncbi:hypothetical protein, partial [Bifidobacterium sp.]|uniref:hypothetical protein n=1 Tax=Bifidobacterium sp. TaxID=41200 RepID=UPI0025BEBECA